MRFLTIDRGCVGGTPQVDMLDVFRELHPEINKVPVAVTFEVNLHVPVHPERLTTVYAPLSSSANALIAAANGEADSDDE